MGHVKLLSDRRSSLAMSLTYVTVKSDYVKTVQQNKFLTPSEPRVFDWAIADQSDWQRALVSFARCPTRQSSRCFLRPSDRLPGLAVVVLPVLQPGSIRGCKNGSKLWRDQSKFNTGM